MATSSETKIVYRSSMQLDRQCAQFGTKHGVDRRLTMGRMIGITCHTKSSHKVTCYLKGKLG